MSERIAGTAVSEGMVEAVACSERDGTIRYVNPAMSRLLGRASEELVGSSVWALFPDAGGKPFRRVFTGVVDTTEADHFEHFSEPGHRWFHNRIWWADERVWMLVRDITEQKLASARHGVGGEVEGFVTLVVDDSERARLMDDLRHAVEARDEFLAIASHELRTPLTALQLQLDGLQRSFERPASEGDPERTRDKLGIAVRQTDRLTVLIDGMLAVSSIATDRFRLELVEFDLTRLLRQVLDRFEEEACRAGSTMTLRGTQPVVGRWDRAGIDQALTNILGNALEYGAGQPVQIEIRSEGSEVTLEVRDRGIGIHHDDLNRIFDRFERAVSPAHYGGFGLGLYITDQIVRAHGGTIAADSCPGEGASFTITLPRWTFATAGSDGKGNLQA